MTSIVDFQSLSLASSANFYHTCRAAESIKSCFNWLGIVETRRLDDFSALSLLLGALSADINARYCRIGRTF